LKVAMWTAVWQPWGGAHSITGTTTLDTRFPGQWYQSETGLHYNWHRSYDPTVGRYTQPDPLGFVDGPSVYGYAGGSPLSNFDPDGLQYFSPRPVLPLPSPWAGPKPAPVPPLPMPRPDVSIEIPEVWPPTQPGGGDCACRCRAGNPGDIPSFRFSERRAGTCYAAAREACRVAVNYCTTAGGNPHHSKALCTDGTIRSGKGSPFGKWKQTI
jgi:RHS repeat-associated protein